MAMAVSMQASSSGGAQRRAPCLIERIDADTFAEHAVRFKVRDKGCRETPSFLLCPLWSAYGIEPAIGEANVLRLKPRAVQFLMLDHVAKLVENWIVFGENERIAELGAKGVPLNGNRITNVFMTHE